MSYETVIGLETHVQLNTRSKAFCADATQFGNAPNHQTSIISLAHPGTLPRLNRAAIEKAIRLGLALGCRIQQRNAFDRKNYFYADLPKGFQTTQDRLPICVGGELNGIRIHHIHLEEDAGKSIHDQSPTESLIDLNRAGVPLLEIVSEPDLRSAAEVVAYMEALRRLVRWLDVSDGNMEEGSLRCDVNISIRPLGQSAFGNRCEIKNVNSMRFAKRAIEYEVARQIAIVEAGGHIQQETRGFDADTGTTYSLREKENAHDYRYFPEPDLPPVVISDTLLNTIRAEMPQLPQALERVWQADLGILAADTAVLAADREVAFYFLDMLQQAQEMVAPKYISNLIINKLLPWCATENHTLTSISVKPASWIEFLKLIASNQISSSTAYQRLFPALLQSPEVSPSQLAVDLNLLQDTDADFLEKIADEVLARFPDKVAEYRKGKKGLLAMFMGELMKSSKGKADPKTATAILQRKLT
jgi:aspartyl-tRNA(Asn)/glutamyl-tRNA(Gln) amidotransferase subunit B